VISLKDAFLLFLDTYTLSFCYWKLCLVWWSHSSLLAFTTTICACLKRIKDTRTKKQRKKADRLLKKKI